MIDSSLSKDSTIYSYRLVKKITHSYLLVTVFWTTLAVFAAVRSLRGEWLPLLWTLPSVFFLQSLLAYCYIRMIPAGSTSVWTFRFGPIWNGLLPEGLAPLPLVKQVHANTFWIGLIAIGLLVPWLPRTALEDFVYFHIWLLWPRGWLLLRLRHKPTGGWMKIGAGDTSCYTQ